MAGKKVLILGGGFAGSSCAAALARAQRRGWVDVTLIDRQNYMVFYPLLVEAGVGSLEPRHTVAPLRRMIGRASFRMAVVLSVDVAGRAVEVELPGIGVRQTLTYDHLVIAVGSVTRLPPVPGLRRFGYQMKSLADAVSLRDRAIQTMELAAAVGDGALRQQLLTWVVVGGNFTGTEVAGEFHHLLQRLARSYGLSPRDVQVVLVERDDRLLGTLDERLSAYALREFQQRGVDVRLNRSVTQLAADHCLLSDGQRLASGTVIWCAGVAPNPLALAADLPRTRGGWIQCDADLRVSGLDHVWAIGDVASNPDVQGRPYPPTAQHAVPMGQAVAANLLRTLRGEATRPFVHQSRGMLAPLGGRDAVAQVSALRLRGTLAWCLWRAFYLWQMPGLGQKVHIAIDWLLDFVLGHELVQLGVHRATRLQEQANLEPGDAAKAA
jgi:NADH dehydrogenase